jgi:hypothetical protein
LFTNALHFDENVNFIPLLKQFVDFVYAFVRVMCLEVTHLCSIIVYMESNNAMMELMM